jgi:hypothetical protein
VKLYNLFLFLILLASLKDIHTKSPLIEAGEKMSPYKFFGLAPQPSPQEIDAAIYRAEITLEDLKKSVSTEYSKDLISLIEKQMNALKAQKAQRTL